MKKYLLVLFVLSFLFVFSGSIVSAQTESNNGSSGYSYQAPASVKPVSFLDNVKLFFTFNKEKKVELLQEFSERNFEIAKEKISEQKPEEAKVLLDEADKDISKATDAVSKFKDEKKQQEALSNISITTSNRTETLSRVLKQVQNPVAQQAITQAIEKQSEIKSDVDEKIQFLLNRIAELEAKIRQLEQEKTGTQPTSVAPATEPTAQEEKPIVGSQVSKCQWKDASTLTQTDGALGQTCLAWAQSFAGPSITQNKLRAVMEKAIDPGNCAYNEYGYSASSGYYSMSTSSKSAVYSDSMEKPIRNTSLLPSSLAQTSNVVGTQICVP